MNKNNQQSKLLLYLKKHKRGISGAEAFSELGIYRLSARIKELREMGHDIVTDWEERVNSDGQRVRYGVYRLRK